MLMTRFKSPGITDGSAYARGGRKTILKWRLWTTGREWWTRNGFLIRFLRRSRRGKAIGLELAFVLGFGGDMAEGVCGGTMRAGALVPSWCGCRRGQRRRLRRLRKRWG